MRQPVQELIERYQKNLYAAAFNICKNQMDAEDVVQETFVQYYTIKKEFERESSAFRNTSCIRSSASSLFLHSEYKYR